MSKNHKYSALEIINYSDDNIVATFIVQGFFHKKVLTLCKGTYNFVEEKTHILNMYNVKKYIEETVQKELILNALSKHDWDSNIDFE